ncbi:hypothetical protein QYF36_005480 [Acer negundo]|nr:hypothetical protein QYF36_005480 [Acer negundo]
MPTAFKAAVNFHSITQSALKNSEDRSNDNCGFHSGSHSGTMDFFKQHVDGHLNRQMEKLIMISRREQTEALDCKIFGMDGHEILNYPLKEEFLIVSKR